MSLRVNEIVRVVVEASDGQVLKKGDAIMLRVSRRIPEDVVCRFVGLSNGYFVTTTLDGQCENKYRQGSIETCYRINGVEKIPSQELDGTSKEATDKVAPDDDAPLLAPDA